MIYRPEAPYRLWDSWLLPEGAGYHLFYLLYHPRRATALIGHARSSDLIHWTGLTPIEPNAHTGDQISDWIGTGSTVLRDGQYYLYFTGSFGGEFQQVGLLLSDDGINWRPYGHNPVMTPVSPNYQIQKTAFAGVDFRDPCITWNEDAQWYEALICAREPDYGPRQGTGACVARYRSPDLLSWEAMAPLSCLGRRFVNVEVPDYFSLGDYHYLLVYTSDRCGSRLNTPQRERVGGTQYMIADRREGPYVLPQNHLLLGAGMGRMEGVVARTIPYQGGRLLYHHIAGDRPAWGLPKVVRQNDDGTLWLGYWDGAVGLRTGTIDTSFPLVQRWQPRAALGQWDESGGVLQGSVITPLSSVFLDGVLDDFEMSCEVIPDAARAAVFIRADPERGQGITVTLDYELNRIEIGPLIPSYIGGLRLGVWDMVSNVPLQHSEPVTLRILARAEFVEVYLNDCWQFTVVTAESDWPPNTGTEASSLSGQIGFGVEGGTTTFRRLELHQLEPLMSDDSLPELASTGAVVQTNEEF